MRHRARGLRRNVFRGIWNLVEKPGSQSTRQTVGHPSARSTSSRPTSSRFFAGDCPIPAANPETNVGLMNLPGAAPSTPSNSRASSRHGEVGPSYNGARSEFALSRPDCRPFRDLSRAWTV